MRTLPHPALATSAALFDPARELAQQVAQRTATRRAFIDMKLGFIRAAARAGGRTGAHLQWRVRQARTASELLALRRDLEGALPPDDHAAAPLADAAG